jgi:hypothetical protein
MMSRATSLTARRAAATKRVAVTRPLTRDMDVCSQAYAADSNVITRNTDGVRGQPIHKHSMAITALTRAMVTYNRDDERSTQGLVCDTGCDVPHRLTLFGTLTAVRSRRWSSAYDDHAVTCGTNIQYSILLITLYLRSLDPVGVDVTRAVNELPTKLAVFSALHLLAWRLALLLSRL